MARKTTGELAASLKGVVEIDSKGGVTVKDKKRLAAEVIETLAMESAVADIPAVKDYANWLIWEIGRELGVQPASIFELYLARGRGEISGFSVPAVNLRGMTFHSARAMLRAAKRLHAGAFIFEIAKSEMGYTLQRPAEYTAQVAAAAIAEGYTGPVFIQGDHFQANIKKFREDRGKEVQSLRDLITEAVGAGFYNIDIDSSTLVDLSKGTVLEQQRDNFEVAAELTAFIRKIEPAGVTVSVGGEIGEVGKKNSTEEELHAFMTGYKETLAKLGADLRGLAKMSVQTGTSHGGVVLPDGTVAKVALDFSVLDNLGRVGREKYAMAGAVQHGASTLPEDAFDKFPAVGTAEVHLATGFQNLLYDSPNLPSALRDRIYAWVKENCKDEWKAGDSEQQFIYKARKKGIGPFKKDFWALPAEAKDRIMAELETKFHLIFSKLRIENTFEVVKDRIPVIAVRKAPPSGRVEGKELDGEGDD
ncbi:MAG: class II fructose-bisphosphate aldolase [Deltaproteobacteria bacterium]|nr:class II fructose-bisphosphate aldolase [Deltaproteobacteria bacterium]